MKITNNSQTRQGLITATGLVFLNPGQSRDVELEEAQLKQAQGRKFWGIEGFERKSESKTLEQVNEGLGGQPLQLQGGPDPRIGELEAQLAEANQTIQRLNSELVLSQARAADLEREKADLVQQRDAMTSEQRQETSVLAGLESKHRGGGSYSVLDADGKELVEKLTKEQHEAFSQMDDAGKTAWVREQQSAQ